MPGTKASEATPFCERLCSGMTWPSEADDALDYPPSRQGQQQIVAPPSTASRAASCIA